MKNILIVSHSNEHAAWEQVADPLAAMGAEVIRFDTDLYPTETMLTTDYANGALHNYLETKKGRINLSDIDACWYRRMYIGNNIPQEMDIQLRGPSVDESRRSFLGVLTSLDCFKLDSYFDVRKASVKQWQLKLASEIGIRIPKTMITNNAEEVRRFYKTCPEGIITKMQSSFAVYEEGQENVVFTNKVDEELLDSLDGLEYCPMTFQEMIPKQLELRVTIVGDTIFSAAIDSQTSERAKTDWRKDGHAMLDQWFAYQLPKELEAKLLQLMDRLKLNYGAIDLILHPNGNYYFLEINPVGEFMWLERIKEFQIGEQIAKVLLGKVSRRNEVGVN